MVRHLLLLRRGLLLLMLAVGPLQAQTVLLCEMMDVPRQESCCCSDLKPARATDTDANAKCDRPPCQTSRSARTGCCAETAEISYEPNTDTPIAKPHVDRSDLDPPDAVLVATYELQPPPSAPEPRWVPRPIPAAKPPGTTLYLRTERLRI